MRNNTHMRALYLLLCAAMALNGLTARAFAAETGETFRILMPANSSFQSLSETVSLQRP